MGTLVQFVTVQQASLGVRSLQKLSSEFKDMGENMTRS